MKRSALTIAALIFAIAAIAQLARYAMGFDVIIDGNLVPLQISLYAGAGFAFLTLWMFLARR